MRKEVREERIREEGQSEEKKRREEGEVRCQFLLTHSVAVAHAETVQAWERGVCALHTGKQNNWLNKVYHIVDIVVSQKSAHPLLLVQFP